MTKPIHLVLFDADRIKDYVFATGRLKEIRGGSQLVRDGSDEEIIRKELALTEDEIIFAEGGAGILVFTDRERAEQKAQELDAFYRSVTRGASLTAIVQTGASFADAKAIGDRRLRMAKDNRRVRLQTMQSPFSQVCKSCGAQPATQLYTVPPVPELLCDWCCVKREKADQLSKAQSTKQRFLLDKTDWGHSFLDYIPKNRAAIWQDAELPETTDRLAALSRPNNYLGFLYADGNSMGSHLQQCTEDHQYRQFSQRVSHSLRAALWLALDSNFPNGPVNGATPFEVIALGGDDLILLCAADRVLPVAVTLSKLFTRISSLLAKVDDFDLDMIHEAGQRAFYDWDESLAEKDALTLSCAAVIAHPKQPILNLEQEALQLLSTAKRAYPGRPAIDFHIVSSPVLRSVTDIRRDEYQLDDETHLTARPLSVTEMEKLLTRIADIKSGSEENAVPRNKLNALYQALFTGQESAAFETFFLYYRMREGQRAKLAAFFNDFDIPTTPSPEGLGMPWGKRQRNGVEGETFTALADLAELYEFVQPDPPPVILADSRKGGTS